MVKKLLVWSVVLTSVLFTGNVHAGYEEVECSTDAVFAEYSCDQCFSGGEKNQDSYIGLMEDVWKNTTENDQVVYKELQSFPEMINLNTSKVTWKQTPSAEGFWEYTEEFNNLYNEEQAGYVLAAGNNVTWLKSKVSSAYHLEKSEAKAGENIGLLVFPLTSNNIIDGEVLVDDSKMHKECVLFKASENETPKETPKELPKTGPEQFLLLFILAMVLAFGVLRFRKG